MLQIHGSYGAKLQEIVTKPIVAYDAKSRTYGAK
jgi:hypothetical protein